MSKVTPFPTKNIPAYMAVMASVMAAGILMWAIYLTVRTGGFELSYFQVYATELVFSLLTAMSGMMVMFTASLINLRKMKSGWEAMAQGKKDVQIPEVWCPVLTAAKDAAEQLMDKEQKLQHN